MAPWVSFSGKDCSGCKHLNDRGYCEFTACIIPCTVRATIPEAKTVTNADLVRSMTDEELADKFEEIQLQAVRAYGNDDLFLKGELKEYWLDWLKQEVNDD